MNELLFFVSAITFIYLRTFTIYFTRHLTLNGLAEEGNPLMKDCVHSSFGSNLFFALNNGLVVAGIYLLFVLREPVEITWFALFLIFFVSWIDFQHDFEWWHERHGLNEIKKLKEAGLLV